MLRKVWQHMEWADVRVMEALDAAPDAPRTARELYAHVLGAELVWLDRLEGQPQSSAVWPEPGPEGDRELGKRAAARRAAYLDGLREQELARPVRYENSAGKAFETAVHDILLHVALHGAYHRGQVMAALSGSGVATVATDYIAYVRGAPAATRADDRRD